MALRLSYKASTTIPIEIEGLTPDWAAGRSLAEIARFGTFHGNEKLPLGESFLLSGSADDGCIVFEGDLSGVHWIGAKMTRGEIRVQGFAGRHLGSGMAGGEIHVAGNAGDWIGAEMSGGIIHVQGRAGNLVGSAYRGSRRGMTGGTILVGGDAGDEIGHSMRRGLLAVAGTCGDFPGINMFAGTVLVGGRCGIRPGAAMQRGTLAVLGSEPPALLPTFRYGGRCRLLYVDLLLCQLRQRSFRIADEPAGGEYDLYHGDFLTSGRGEIVARRGKLSCGKPR